MSPSELNALTRKLFENFKRKLPISPTDFWSVFLENTFLKLNNEHQYKYFGDLFKSNIFKNYEVPYPIISAILTRMKVDPRDYHRFVEFTPLVCEIPQLATRLPISAFGSRFDHGNIIRPYSNDSMSYLVYFLFWKFLYLDCNFLHSIFCNSKKCIGCFKERRSRFTKFYRKNN